MVGTGSSNLLLLTAILLAWPAAESVGASMRILYPMRMDAAHEPIRGFSPPAAWRRRAQAADGAGGSAGATVGASASNSGVGANGGGGGGGDGWAEEAETHYQWLVVTDGSRGDLLRQLARGGEGGGGAILVPPTGVAVWATAARAYELSEHQGVSSGTAAIATAPPDLHRHHPQQQQQHPLRRHSPTPPFHLSAALTQCPSSYRGTSSTLRAWGPSCWRVAVVTVVTVVAVMAAARWRPSTWCWYPPRPRTPPPTPPPAPQPLRAGT